VSVRNEYGSPIRPDVVLYHGNCHDGWTAAWVVGEQFYRDPNIVYLPMSYGPLTDDVLELCRDKHVAVLDFSFKYDDMLRLIHASRTIVVLDHHKSAQVELRAFVGDPIENAKIVFDMDKSGARLAWDHYYDPGIVVGYNFADPDSHVPPIVRYVEDRDLWRFALPNSRSINAYLQIQPLGYPGLWSEINQDLISAEDGQAIVEKGETLLAATEQHCRQIIDSTKRTISLKTVDGTFINSIPCIQAPYHLFSEAVGTLAEESPNGLAAGYLDNEKGRQFTLRSRKGGCDCTRIAVAYGGGGHAGAAGFSAEHGWFGEEETAKRDRYMPMAQQVYTNDAGEMKIGVAWHGDHFGSLSDAIKAGFVWRESDDFNVCIIRDGLVASVRWMREEIELFDPQELIELNKELGYVDHWGADEDGWSEFDEDGDDE